MFFCCVFVTFFVFISFSGQIRCKKIHWSWGFVWCWKFLALTLLRWECFWPFTRISSNKFCKWTMLGLLGGQIQFLNRKTVFTRSQRIFFVAARTQIVLHNSVVWNLCFVFVECLWQFWSSICAPGQLSRAFVETCFDFPMAVSTVPCFLAPEQLVSLSGKILRNRTFGFEMGSVWQVWTWTCLASGWSQHLLCSNIIDRMQSWQILELLGKHFKTEAETLLPSKAKALEDSPRRSQSQIRFEPVARVKKHRLRWNFHMFWKRFVWPLSMSFNVMLV
jgi:hypothetical protein